MKDTKDTKNNEGLTFEEWVCAAGVAVIDMYSVGVKPYSSSRYSAFHRIYHGRKVRESIRHYPVKTRNAWKAGEDPTEWRAQA